MPRRPQTRRVVPRRPRRSSSAKPIRLVPVRPTASRAVASPPFSTAPARGGRPSHGWGAALLGHSTAGGAARTSRPRCSSRPTAPAPRPGSRPPSGTVRSRPRQPGPPSARASRTTAPPGSRHGDPSAAPARQFDTMPATAAPSARPRPAPRTPRASSYLSAPATTHAAGAARPVAAPADTAHTGSQRRPPPPTPPSISVPDGPSVPHVVVLLKLYGRATRDWYKFCGACGSRFGAPVEADSAARAGPPATPSVATRPDSYTPRHLADRILASRADLEGERKQFTVLFADVVGSTELIRDLDPEDARALLEPAVRAMIDAVHRFEGTVCRVMGDGVMALFGAPLAHEDHAARAAYAALTMQEAIRRYGEVARERDGVEVLARVGLNSGEVVVGAISNDLYVEYSAIGPTTHLAARMEQLAVPGTVRLTGETLRLVDGLVETRSLGKIPVKGLPEPIEAFELIGAGPTRRRFQAAAARGLTPFVGRQAELDALQRALGLAQDGHGQVVAPGGEPGVGKSRLLYEFVHSQRTRG